MKYVQNISTMSRDCDESEMMVTREELDRNSSGYCDNCQGNLEEYRYNSK
jgi:uncharacterized paraquat-inducible protein A